MKNQLNQFFEKCEYCDFEIILRASYHEDILEGYINFYDYDFICSNEEKIDLSYTHFFIFNIYNLDDLEYLADHISSDIEYVASSYRNYCDDIAGLGTVVIIDELSVKKDFENRNDKVKIIKYFLAKIIKKLQTLGIGTLLLMSKALNFNLTDSDRVFLINELLDFNIIPIYQDCNDVILARNLDYKI